jgi:hypothetical protein
MGLAQLVADPSARQLPLDYLFPPSTAKTSEPVALGAAPEDSLLLGGADTLSQAFEALIYRKQSVQTAVSLSSTRTAASISNENGSASAVSDQLEFSFYREVRSEELAQFRQRTEATAEGLGGSRETYVQASQRVAARFELSITISGEALVNYAGASEELADQEDLLNKLLEFANGLLDKADDLFNEFFSTLAGGGTSSFEDLFHKLQQQFGGGMLDALSRLLGEGTAAAPGATSASGSAAVQLQFSFSASFEMQTEVAVQQSDPIILDLDGDGFELTHHSKGARFDILGNGSQQNTAFVTGGDAFLALDRNGNGSIDSGAELFGDQRGAANGYEELRKLDDNRDGVIDAKDAAYDSLLLFKDDGDGKTEDGELITLREAGIAEISIQYANVNENAAGGNRMAQLASYRRTNGNIGRAGDAILNYTV